MQILVYKLTLLSFSNMLAGQLSEQAMVSVQTFDARRVVCIRTVLRAMYGSRKPLTYGTWACPHSRACSGKSRRGSPRWALTHFCSTSSMKAATSSWSSSAGITSNEIWTVSLSISSLSSSQASSNSSIVLSSLNLISCCALLPCFLTFCWHCFR